MNSLVNGFLVVFSPRHGWQRIAEGRPGLAQTLFLHTIPFALIPAVCWYFGVTTQGWVIMGDPVKLTEASALPMCILFYLAMVFGVVFLGYMVNWMAGTYSTQGGVAKSIALISYTASPFFLAGILGLYPVLWLDIMVGTLVACYCIYLLFLGIGPVMEVPPERAFLYASAVFAVALVSFVALLGATVVLWDLGPTPEYTY
ncbi:MAG TPA: Yip1 family protein [Pseudomonadales bacterium]